MSTPQSMMPPFPLVPDDGLKVIAQKARESSVDDFRVKILRRASPTALADAVAVLDGAKVEHFSAPEAWLVPLCGGGPQFILTVYHASDLSSVVASIIPPMIPLPPHPVDPSVMVDGWNGPSKLVFALTTAAPKQPARPVDPSIFGLVGGDGTPGTAPRTQSLPPSPPASFSTTDQASYALAQLARERREVDEARHRMEVEAAKRQADEQIRRLEQKVTDALTALSKPHEPVKTLDLPTLITGFIAAVGPLAMKFMEKSDADRRFAMELDAKREERMELQRAEASRRQDLLMERVSAQTGESAKAAAANVEAMGMMARTMVQTIASTQELLAAANPPPPETSFMDMIKGGIEAFAQYAATSRMAQIEAAQKAQAQKRLAAAKPPAPPKGPQQPIPSTAPGAPPAASTATPLTPAEVMGSPEAEEASEEEPEGEEIDLTTADPNEVVSYIVTGLQNHVAAAEVAEVYLDALANPGVHEQIQAAGGTVPFFQAKLGATWVDEPANFSYIRDVLAAAQAEAKARGTVPS